MEMRSTDLIAGLGHLALGTRLKRIGETLQAGVGEALAARRITVQPAHIPILVALRQSGGMTVGELAMLLGQSQPGISRGLRELADRNLIRLSPGRDRRIKTASLSEGGISLMQEIDSVIFPRVRAAAEALCAGLEGGLLKQLGELDRRLARQPFAQRIEGKG